MTDAIQTVLDELKHDLKAIYGPRLKGVYLFGSCARMEEDEESDIDVLVVLEKMGRYRVEIERTSAVVSKLSLKYGRSISCVYADEARWLYDRTSFYENVREEAVPA